LNIKSNIFERISKIADHYGLEGIPELAEKLGYNSPEKLYRLNRSETARPSFDMISDFASAFDTLNLRWFITGKGSIEKINTNEFDKAAEPGDQYQTSGSKEVGLFKLLAAELFNELEPRLKNYDKKLEELHDRISLKEEIEDLKSEISNKGAAKTKG
tara:strand:+ start:1040 stop:1513 length:474 start_codon:yes stop_codon:yes gene_type:complete